MFDKRRLNVALSALCLFVSVPPLSCAKAPGAPTPAARETRPVTTTEPVPQISDLIARLESGSQPDRREAIVSLHRLGKEAIPSLIENVSNGKELPVSLVNPNNSDLRESMAAKTYAGTLSAYVIELILRREEIRLNPDDHPQFLLGNNPDNYAYWNGVIKKGGAPAGRANLPLIKKKYADWWEKNKSSTLEKLREEQKAGSPVLDKRPFYWL